MEDSWICIDEDDDSLHSASDSDVIDSEIEAELYSTIHFEENLNSNNAESVNLFIQSNNCTVSTPSKNVFCTVEKKDINNHLTDTLKSLSNNLDSLGKNETFPKKNIFLNNKLEPDLNPIKKLKFDHEKEKYSAGFYPNNSKDGDANELPKHTNLNQTQNRNNIHAEQFHQQIKNEVDSSDSDGILWEREEDSSKRTNFETNLMKDGGTIYLSSSDSDNELLLSPSSRRELVLRNLSMPNIKIGESSGGPWHINDEDLYRSRKHSRRYHENIDVTCSNCNKRGHNFKTCPAPKKVICFICGDAHQASQCMNRMCSNCYNYGHDRNRCRMRPNNFFCMLCHLRGHTEENCPDLWRRYHLTTKPVKIIQGKNCAQQYRNIYCWNCGNPGHFGAVCNYRYPRNISTWPCVISYDDIVSYPHKGLNEEKSVNFHPRSEKLNKNEGKSTDKKGKVARSKKNACLKQKNEFNAANAVGKSERKRKNWERRNKRMENQINNLEKILGEQDFPRTPKNQLLKQEIPDNSEVPESVELTMRKRLRNKMRRLKRKLKRQQKKGVNPQNLQVINFNKL